MKRPRPFAKRFYQILRRIREHASPDIPVSVKTVSAGELKRHHGCDVWGDARIGDGKATIRINRKQSTDSAIDTLIHEWAHVIDQSANPNIRDLHRDSWGVAYASVYRAAEKETAAELERR